jgi:hypothetical protein
MPTREMMRERKAKGRPNRKPRGLHSQSSQQQQHITTYLLDFLLFFFFFLSSILLLCCLTAFSSCFFFATSRSRKYNIYYIYIYMDGEHK